MIEINKLNGCIKILEFWIEPYDNIEKIKKILKNLIFLIINTFMWIVIMR